MKNLQTLKVKASPQKCIWILGIWPILSIIMVKIGHVQYSTKNFHSEKHHQHYYYTCWTHFYPDVGFSYMCNAILSWATLILLTKVPQKSISKCIYKMSMRLERKRNPTIAAWKVTIMSVVLANLKTNAMRMSAVITLKVMKYHSLASIRHITFIMHYGLWFHAKIL